MKLFITFEPEAEPEEIEQSAIVDAMARLYLEDLEDLEEQENLKFEVAQA